MHEIGLSYSCSQSYLNHKAWGGGFFPCPKGKSGHWHGCWEGAAADLCFDCLHSPARWRSVPTLTSMRRLSPWPWHQTDELKQEVINQTYSQSPRWRHSLPSRATQGHPGLALRNRPKEQGWWKVGFVVNPRVGWPLVSSGGCDWFVWIISQAGRELKSIRLRTVGDTEDSSWPCWWGN